MTNSIKESTLYLFADSISDSEVVANPEATEKLFKLISVLRRGLCSETDFCDSVKRAVAGLTAMRPAMNCASSPSVSSSLTAPFTARLFPPTPTVVLKSRF